MTGSSRTSSAHHFDLPAPIDIYTGLTRQTKTGESLVRSPPCLYRNNDRSFHPTDRLLMPVFGTGAIRDMFPAMEDIVSQLVTKWERFATFILRYETWAKMVARRFGPDHVIDPSKDFTKLTLDAIALASMSYRMNSFYSVSRAPALHPIVLTYSSGRYGAFRSCVGWGSQRVPTAGYTPAHRNSNNEWYSSAI